MSKAAHHRGTYQVTRDKVVAIAAANPLTLCWRCKRPLAAHPPHSTGRPAAWTGGHTIKESQTYQGWLRPMISPTDCDAARAGDFIAPEASVCNRVDADDHMPDITTTRRW